ncbi:MAG: arginine--tRNA ligase [Actinobacteria bacterium]|nr:arginine--tRNA ligase [Actinomycetota bacterium]
MADPLFTISSTLRAAFAVVTGLPPEEIDPVVRPSDRADAQANGALALARQLGKQPREIAEAVVATGMLAASCSVTEVAGPGFINLTFKPEFLASELADAAGDERLGVRLAGQQRTVVIDYSHPNVAKEMHVGHLRTTIIGDSLVRLLRFVGHRTILENHIGDWGRQFGMLIEHLLDLGETEGAHELSVGDLNTFYREAARKFDDNDEFKDRSRRRVVELQGGDAETLRLWHLLVDESMRYFNQVYAQLGVLLSNDDLMGESAYNDMLAMVVDRLRDQGLLQHSQGAEVVFADGFVNREGDPLPLIVRNSLGGFLYAATDLACIIDRVERLHADLLVYVVGAPQAHHLNMVFAVARMAGWLAPPVEAVHVAFGNVLGEDRKMFKSRTGDTVKLSDLLDEAVARATASVREKNPEMSPSEQAEVGEMIGIGAIKYADLSTDRLKDYVFDWERMLAFDGNTAPYLQYAHARICSIFRRADLERASLGSIVPSLAAPQERALALALLQFDTTVHDTLDKFSPHRLCTYLFELAQAFTSFYEACPVLKDGHEATRESRLALCDITARTLHQGLFLLGIEAPERM